MEYRDFTIAALEQSFIRTSEKADHTVKATIGLIASLLEEDEARTFTKKLPDPLTFEKLRSDQMHPTRRNVDEGIAGLASQFNFEEEEARQMLEKLLKVTREAIGDETFTRIAEKLPEDWPEFIENI